MLRLAMARAPRRVFAGLASLAALILLPLPSAAQQPADLSALFAEHHLKEDIVKPPRGLLHHEYLVPSGPYFQLFDWDTYFMGVALSYDHRGRALAGSVEDFLDFTDEHANWLGYTPREIAPDSLWALPEMCKPFLAQAALRASLTLHDASWLAQPSGASHRSYLQKLADTLTFWERSRRAPDGLFVWFDGVESGVDNNPAVSDDPTGITEGVDLQTYVYREYLAMAVLSGWLGHPAAAAEYRARAAHLRSAMQRLLWSAADGLYYNRDARSGRWIRVKTWTDLAPLWAGIPTQEQARRMIEDHLLNAREFWAPDGVRSLAADEPLYNPQSGYWRGPVWVISDYLLMHGLLHYGYRAQARELAAKTTALLARDLRVTGGMNENYNPETGAPDAGGHFVSWDLLAEHMAAEAQSGFDPAAIRPPAAARTAAAPRG